MSKESTINKYQCPQCLQKVQHKMDCTQGWRDKHNMDEELTIEELDEEDERPSPEEKAKFLKDWHIRDGISFCNQSFNADDPMVDMLRNALTRLQEARSELALLQEKNTELKQRLLWDRTQCAHITRSNDICLRCHDGDGLTD